MDTGSYVSISCLRVDAARIVDLAAAFRGRRGPVDVAQALAER